MQLRDWFGDEGTFEDRTNGIFRALTAKSGKSYATISSYLRYLEMDGFIEMGRAVGRRGVPMIISLRVKKVDMLPHALRAKLTKEQADELLPAPRTTLIKKLPKVPDPSVALLIDFDNATIGAEEASYVLSFAKLVEYVRLSFGKPIERMAFVSPRSWGKSEWLFRADILPVLCPPYIKDKDSVDEKIKERVRLCAEYLYVRKIVVVTADGDIAKDPGLVVMAANFGTELHFLDTRKLKDVLEGEEERITLQSSSLFNSFGGAVECIESGTPARSTNEETKTDFLCTIYKTIKEVCAVGQYSFRPLLEEVWERRLSTAWRGIFNKEDARIALSVFTRRGILRSYQGRSRTYYTPNLSHPFCVKAQARLDQGIKLAVAGNGASPRLTPPPPLIIPSSVRG
jgi:hypothetical protein